MKKLLLVFAATALLTSCGIMKQVRVEGSEVYTPADLTRFSPNSLTYGDSIGLNWWRGTFDGKPVLIHAVQTYWYVNIDLTFIPEDK